jgi:dolichol-phosphate mannosyltransferase
MSEPEYSFVIPVHNEVETLPELGRRLSNLFSQLDGSAQVLLVDDGSTDGSFEAMRTLHESDPRFQVLRLSRNFGHQIAITAGLDHIQGKAVVIMDADLQDPPEVVLEMAKRWREGYSVVYGVRQGRHDEGIVKRNTARWFYRFLNRITDVPIPLDAGDFRLVDRNALTAIRSMREHNRYLRGMFAWVGFDQTGVQYVRPARFAGTTKFSLRRMITFATDGILSFSAMPLRIALNVGFLISTVAFLAGFAAIVSRVAGAFTVPGWLSLTLAVAFLGGVQLMVLGVMGEYIARIYEEVRRRPLYLVREGLGLDVDVPVPLVDRPDHR